MKEDDFMPDKEGVSLVPDPETVELPFSPATPAPLPIPMPVLEDTSQINADSVPEPEAGQKS